MDAGRQVLNEDRGVGVPCEVDTVDKADGNMDEEDIEDKVGDNLVVVGKRMQGEVV